MPSSALVPNNDPTLLFTNAGMVQFKEYFLGQVEPPYTRAVSSQKVVRAGGKHNDLDNVGYTARHHTFFEMLGNFSFGDYFKQDAIVHAWQFLTEVLEIPAEKLWITVFKTDQEAFDIWHDQIGLASERIIRLGDDDNFWSMGDTGPCGPCTEIFYDHGADVPGGMPGSDDADGDRYIEIWNIVFMEFERQVNGEMLTLPKPSVDTGMGLERIAAVLQGVHNNYEIDLFQALIAGIVKQLPKDIEKKSQSLRVVADHIRSCVFLILDGVLPANEGRGYVLRRIIRRAIRHLKKMGVNEPIFYQCLQPLTDVMGDAYPELVFKNQYVASVLLREETRFLETLDQGLKILSQSMQEGSGAVGSVEGVVSGELAFTLHDTYGFPLDLTMDVAREKGYIVDCPAFETLMTQQKQRSKNQSSFASHEQYQRIEGASATTFFGYDLLEMDAQIVLILDESFNPVQQLSQGAAGYLVLDNTPFYPESGGQVGDSGTIEALSCGSDRVSGTEQAVFSVSTTQKKGDVFIHQGQLTSGVLSVAQPVKTVVNRSIRDAIRNNHSATHLLHASLKDVLGDHVQQKGSLVTSDRLRFDFLHESAMSQEELFSVEQMIQRQIMADTPVVTEIMDMQMALDAGATALFGEKYSDQVRVLSMGIDAFSKELCGGTHVARTGEIGAFLILQEIGVSAGVRRIEAVTGLTALTEMQSLRRQFDRVQQFLKVPSIRIADKVSELQEQLKSQQKQLVQLQLAQGVAEYCEKAIIVNQAAVLVSNVMPGLETKALRELADRLIQKIKSPKGVSRGAIVVLASVQSADKIQLVVSVEKSLSQSIQAGDIAAELAKALGGKGGGKPTMAMAGGQDVSQLSQVLSSMSQQLQEALLKGKAQLEISS